MNPFQSLNEYERFIYTLSSQYTAVRRSTLTLIRRGKGTAIVRGDIEINSYRLVIREVLSFALESGRLLDYGYEVWQGNEKLYWYDPQPHPHIPELALNHPHHKHIPPDIKHHRIPAPQLTFNQPNLPFLIAEILALPA
jgi:hypothetical protein